MHPELLQLQVELIAISGTIGTLAAKRATTSIPVVMLTIEAAGAELRYLPPYSPDLNRRRAGLYFSLLVRMQNERVGSPGWELR